MLLEIRKTANYLGEPTLSLNAAIRHYVDVILSALVWLQHDLDLMVWLFQGLKSVGKTL